MTTPNSETPAAGAPTPDPATEPPSGRRRWTRTTLVVATLAAVVVVVATFAALVHGGGSGHAASAAGPTSESPSLRSTPSSTPSTEPSAPSTASTVGPDGRALPGKVTVDPMLPHALPLPAGIWNRTTSGWVLASYLPSILGPGPVFHSQVMFATKHLVYLVSPDGKLYQVVEMDPAQPFRIESWRPGDTIAYVRTCVEPGSCKYDGTSGQVLDLTTGKISPVDVPFDPTQFRISQTTPDGVRVWDSRENGGTYLERDGTFTFLGEKWSADGEPLSPNGAWLALSAEGTYTPQHPEDQLNLAAVSLATGEVVVTSTPACGGGEWIDATHLSSNCFGDPWADGGTTTKTTSVMDVTSGLTEVVSTEEVTISDSPERGRVDARVSHDVRLSPGVWIGYYDDGAPIIDQGMDRAPAPLAIDDHGSLAVIPITDASGHPVFTSSIVATVGTVVYLDARMEDQSSVSFDFVVAYDWAKRNQRVLLPAPPDWPDSVEIPGVNVHSVGIESWVVAR